MRGHGISPARDPSPFGDRIKKFGEGEANTITNGQTMFTLDYTPDDSNEVIMDINGVMFRPPESFSISGTTVTWTNTVFTLSSTDHIIIYY